MTGVLSAENGLGGLMDFDLPSRLEATHPPEELGRPRDDVRLLAGYRRSGAVEHHRFSDLPALLERGDVLAVNTSTTLPASLEARTPSGAAGELHLSTRRPDGRWVVELRHVQSGGRRPFARPASTPWLDAEPGTELRLIGGGLARLLSPDAGPAPSGGPTRLWVAELDLGRDLFDYLARYGRPIRYGYIDHDHPIAAYQTVFAGSIDGDEALGLGGPGSAEMPSAGRPFSAELVTRLVGRGVVFAPFLLHCGVASPESHEPPSAEWYHVPAETAEQVNVAHRLGHRVVAVGTTAVRALETVADSQGQVRPGQGWTRLVIGPERGVGVVDGLITGWHEPHASHLALVEAIAGRPLMETSYQEALAAGYLWHEFGDSHLILP